MNSSHTEGNVLRTAKKILGLAGLASLAFIFAGPIRAQSKPALFSATTSARVALVNPAPATLAATPATATAQAPAQDSSAKKSTPRGQHEGITVHGHWIIEVRNPDGKLASHTEFENALSPGFPFPIISGLTAQVSSGAAFLSALMAGQAVITPGNWAILLEGTFLPLPSPGAPCVTAQTYGSCFIFSSATVPNFVQGPICNGGVPGGPGLSCNLTVSPLGTAQNLTGFQLSGTVAATQAGTVSAVATMNFNACGPPIVPNCPFFIPAVNDGLVALTARNLDGNTPTGAAAGDPNPVPVTSGQTIAVTVTITFQ
jgi:hypothetical protein